MEEKNEAPKDHSPFDFAEPHSLPGYLDRMIREVSYGKGPWYGVVCSLDLKMFILWESSEKPFPALGNPGMVVLNTSRGKTRFVIGRVCNSRKKAVELAEAWALISGRYDWPIQTH